MYWTYAVITLGFSLFFSGLVGWVGGASESTCLVRLFLMFIVLSMLAEIGGIITLNIFDKGFEDILEHGWREVNQGTRNLVQKHLACCGWQGLQEFANNDDPIDESCYEAVSPSLSGIVTSEIEPGTTRRMKQSPCMENLRSWFEDNKISWVTILAVVAAIQVMCVVISVYVLQKVDRMAKIRNTRTVSKRKLYDSSSDDGEDHKYMHRI